MAAGEASPGPLSLDSAARLVFDHLAIPVCVLDAQARLVAMNPAAERFWGMRLEEVAGTDAADVLGVRPLEPAAGPASPLEQALGGSSERVPCRITGRDGLTHVAAIVGTRLEQGDYATVAVTAERDSPAWALIDPVTGVPNRLAWREQRERWTHPFGAAVLFDVDDLKEINDLRGHRAGDQALASVGTALRALLPDGACALRWGGDEFLVLLPGATPDAARLWATGVAERAAGAGPAAHPALSFGVSAIAPGDVEGAVEMADEALYEAKGVLFRAESGARLLLTREGQRLLVAPADGPVPPSADYASRFTTSFDAHFRAVLRRAAEQAREFVAFAAPPAGGAVVEVGAGSGRITLDGGLAERVGPRGQLLATDPSAAQLHVLRTRLGALSLPWVRLLRAPAEGLPVAAACADMVIGSTFLHFTDPPRVLREFARVLRPGGRFALAAPLPSDWPPFLQDALIEPAADEARRLGLTLRPWAVPEQEILVAIAAAGLQVERTAHMDDHADAPTPAVAQAFIKQTRLVGLLLRGAPEDRLAAVEEEVLRRVVARWDAYTGAERGGSFVQLHLVARKP